MAETKVTDKERWLNELSVIISDTQCAYNVTLKGYNNILAYFKAETDFWNGVTTEIGKQRQGTPSSLSHTINFHLSRFNEMNTMLHGVQEFGETDLQRKFAPIKASIEQRTSPKIMLSKSSIGVFLAELYSLNASRGDGAYRYFNGQAIDLHDVGQWRGFIDAHLFERKVDTTVSDRYQAELSALDEVRNDWEQKSQDASNLVQKITTELNTWKDGFTDGHSKWTGDSKNEYSEFVKMKKEELGNLDKAYREKLKIEAPVKYWQERAARYRKRGYWWLAGLATVIGILGILLTLLLYNLPEAFHHKLFSGEAEAIKGIILLATIVSLGVYLARVFARMTFSSFHIERDAEEREQLTLIYLSLTAEGKVGEKERDIVLQALFSRVETGLLGDDSSPTMPIVGSFLEEISRKK